MGLLIATKLILVRAQELGDAAQDLLVLVVALNFVPHTARRIGMAMGAARRITGAASGNGWAVKLHAQLLHAGSITGAFYAAEAAALATGWEQFAAMDQRIEVQEGVILNATVVRQLDAFLRQIRWTPVTVSIEKPSKSVNFGHISRKFGPSTLLQCELGAAYFCCWILSCNRAAVHVAPICFRCHVFQNASKHGPPTRHRPLRCTFDCVAHAGCDQRVPQGGCLRPTIGRENRIESRVAHLSYPFDRCQYILSHCTRHTSNKALGAGSEGRVCHGNAWTGSTVQCNAPRQSQALSQAKILLYGCGSRFGAIIIP